MKFSFSIFHLTFGKISFGAYALCSRCIFRSVSVDSKPKPVLSRRQILASLEEENSFGSSSSSGSRWSSSTPSSSPSEPMFSRSCLIQSISHDEENQSENSERLEK